MYHTRSMPDRVLAMLLSLVLCLTMVPQLAFATAAAPCVTGSTGDTEYTVTTGGLLTVYLDELFKDSEGHTMTYQLDTGDYGTQTKITTDKDSGRPCLSFTNPTAGIYTPTITASCPNGGMGKVTLTITVEQGKDGDASQYGYDETPADSVKVYVTVSSDGIPLMGNEGTLSLIHI